MASYAEEVLADSPVGYWRLGEAPGATIAVDSSGNSHDGTIKGSPVLGIATTVGDGDTAYEFDGVDSGVATADRVIIPHHTSFNYATGKKWTVTALVKLGTPADNATIISNQVVDGALYTPKSFQLIRRGSRGLLRGYMYENTGTLVVDSTFAPLDNAFYHVALTYDNGTLKLYIDGVLDATNSTGSGDITSQTSDISIGGQYADWGNLNGIWDGTIDEVAYYTDALDATRILAHYAAIGNPATEIQAPPTASTSTWRDFRNFRNFR